MRNMVEGVPVAIERAAGSRPRRRGAPPPPPAGEAPSWWPAPTQAEER